MQEHIKTIGINYYRNISNSSVMGKDIMKTVVLLPITVEIIFYYTNIKFTKINGILYVINMITYIYYLHI